MTNRRRIGLFACAFLATAIPRPVGAHCDTLEGPVARDARAALEARDVALVLKWVRAVDEEEVRGVFAQTLAARGGGEAARAVADRLFLETVVRLHRAGEGAPFEGLRPAGAVDPAAREADEALEGASVDALARRITDAVERAIRERFARVRDTREHAGESVEKGRAFVAAYVDYVHHVERLWHDAAGVHPGEEGPRAPERHH